MPQSPTNLNHLTLHGVFIDVFDLGVLLIGASGIGKSELALGLINRGHRLIADDSVYFERGDDKVIGSCSDVLQDFLEVRGLGILNIRKMFGDQAMSSNKPLNLIICLKAIKDKDIIAVDRLFGMFEDRDILGKTISEVTIPVAPGRSLSILVEAAVRNHALKKQGYEGTIDFQQRQRQFMSQQHAD